MKKRLALMGMIILIVLNGCSSSKELDESNIDITLLNLATYENGFEMDFKITNNSDTDMTNVGFYMNLPFNEEKDFIIAGKSGDSEVLPALIQGQSTEFNILVPQLGGDSSSIDLESLLIKIVGTVEGEPIAIEGSINVMTD